MYIEYVQEWVWKFMLLFKETRKPHCHYVNKKTTKTRNKTSVNIIT